VRNSADEKSSRTGGRTQTACVVGTAVDTADEPDRDQLSETLLVTTIDPTAERPLQVFSPDPISKKMAMHRSVAEHEAKHRHRNVSVGTKVFEAEN
jgi:hypothetical protein